MSWDNWIKEQDKFKDYFETMEYFVEEHKLKERDRTRHKAYKRFFWFDYLYNKRRWTLQRIADFFGVTHASVIHGIRQWQVIKVYPDVKEIKQEYERTLITGKL